MNIKGFDTNNKTAYIDIDGTICFHARTSEQLADSIIFESTDNLASTPLVDKSKFCIDFFGVNSIYKDTYRHLKEMKDVGVRIVGVTARDKISTRYIKKEFLDLFDVIYNGGFDVFNPKTDDIAKFNYIELKPNVLADTQKKIDLMKSILKKEHVDYINNLPLESYYYFPVNAESAYINQKLSNLEGFKVSVVNFNHKELYCVYLGGVSKADYIKYDKQLNDVSLAICAGDSIDDLDMLAECNCGVYPTSLIQLAIKQSKHYDYSKVLEVAGDFPKYSMLYTHFML